MGLSVLFCCHPITWDINFIFRLLALPSSSLRDRDMKVKTYIRRSNRRYRGTKHPIGCRQTRRRYIITPIINCVPRHYCALTRMKQRMATYLTNRNIFQSPVEFPVSELCLIQLCSFTRKQCSVHTMTRNCACSQKSACCGEYVSLQGDSLDIEHLKSRAYAVC